MAKVKQDKAKGPRHSPSHSPEIQIPLALVAEPVRPVKAGRGAQRTVQLASAAAPPRRDAARETQLLAGRPRAARGTPAKQAPLPSRDRQAPRRGQSSKKPARAAGAERGPAVASGGKTARKEPSRKPAPSGRPAKRPALKSRPVGALRGVSPRGAAKNGGPKTGKHLERREPERVVRVKELDPFARCGPRTSVEHLIRVEERLDGESSVHLVFFDRHGWYCEHGKACRAVDDVRRHGKQLGLTF